MAACADIAVVRIGNCRFSNADIHSLPPITAMGTKQTFIRSIVDRRDDLRLMW